MKKIRIAYSICGEGHGHYGRNIKIIKSLSKRLLNCEIVLYLYGDTLNIFSMDRQLPENVRIKKIPGFKFVYKKTGFFNSISSTAINTNNLAVFIRIIKLNFFYIIFSPLRRLIAIIRKKRDDVASRYYKKYFSKFDFAITDLEPLLPRVALLRDKPFLTFDNQHTMLYGDLDIKKFNFNERLEHFFVSNFLKTYHPRSDLSVLTTFCEIPIKSKYKNKVKAIGPLIRKKIIDVKNKIKYDDYILVYAHKILKDKLFPIFTRLQDYKYVVFTTVDFNDKEFSYKRDWIEYHSIDPVKFIGFLSKCKAVISTAGNTLISEALFLKKPFFAIGLEGQFEQRLNLYLLEKNKLGEGCKISELSDEHIRCFINNIEKYQKRLQKLKIYDDTDKLVNLIINKIDRDVFMPLDM